MMRVILSILLLVSLFIAQVELLERGENERARLDDDRDARIGLPSPILKAMALEFEGVISDYVFLETLVFTGKSFEREEKPRIREYEWDWMVDRLNAATDLDPYFLDPYYFANSELIWDGERIAEAIELFEKGTRYRTWDWMPPFFAGFAAHYFMRDDQRAAELLMEAARRPDAAPLIATLAARVAAGANMKGNAVLFLQSIVDHAPDPYTATLVNERLKAIRGMFLLEQSVEQYQQQYGRLPTALNDLVSAGILTHLPEEPYGGEYLLDPVTGQVRSSTDLGKFAE